MSNFDWEKRIQDALRKRDNAEFTKLIWQLKLGQDQPPIRNWADYERRFENNEQSFMLRIHRLRLSPTMRELPWEGSRASLSWLAPNGETIQHFLADTPSACSIGRARDRDIVLSTTNVSRRHALLTAVGADWWIEDTRSTNGTRIRRGQGPVVPVLPGTREMLLNDDLICLGRAELRFSNALAPIPGVGTDDDALTPLDQEGVYVRELGLTSQESKVLNLLCEPRLSGGSWRTNDEIAAELFITKATVRSHMKALYSKFSIPEEGLSREQRRFGLVQCAIAGGWVSPPPGPHRVSQAGTDSTATQQQTSSVPSPSREPHKGRPSS